MQSEQNRRKKALLGTVVFHVFLLVVFMFTGLTQPDPIPEEIGVEVSLADFGNSFTGSGNTKPTKVAEPKNNPAPKPVPKTSSNTAPETKVAEDPNSDVSVNKPNLDDSKKKTVTKEEKKKEEVKEEPKPEVNKKALYPGKKSQKSTEESGSSQGNKKGTGDMGSAEGKPSGKGVLGGGQGSWELSGRSLLQGARIDDTREEGTVVLNIWVDRYGNVIRSTPDLQRSTTTSQYLFEKAKQAAAKTKYSPKGDAAAEQKGRMTFKFILR